MFVLNEEDEAFRQELKRYLEVNHPGKQPRHADVLPWQRAWAARLVDDGYAMPSWPREWGGMELSLTQQYVYHETMAMARLRPHPWPNIGIIGPTLIVHGTEWQRERFLKPLVRADEIWCQGFSEPDAGSDLPGIRTRAVLDGDHYVVTGQKIWTSMGEVADWMFALVRTGTPDSREHGITYLLIDMRSRGLSVGTLRDMAGGARFCEVFFDEVRVPVGHRVGEHDGGWAIVRTSLGHERSTAFIARAIGYRRILDELFSLGRECGSAERPLLRDALADLEVQLRVQILNGMRSLSNAIRDGDPGPAASVSRLSHAEFEKRLHEVALDVLGANAMLGANDPNALERGRWVRGFLNTRASTIGAGTSEIQRNAIAERVLGLPHEPGMARPKV